MSKKIKRVIQKKIKSQVRRKMMMTKKVQLKNKVNLAKKKPKMKLNHNFPDKY